MAAKFIIADDQLIMGHVDLHRELYKDTSKILGGGWWYINKERTKAYLYSKSFDFGRVTKDQLVSALENSYLSGGVDKMEIYFSESDELSEAIEHGEQIVFNPINFFEDDE